MKTICCANMPFAKEAFGLLGDTVVKDGRHIVRDDLSDVEIMAIRSTLKVNRSLLEGSPVRFVGTATIGTDHIDIPWLESAGIRWCFAPGCNANSVSEYVTVALLLLASRHGFNLKNLSMGIIGVGNVGSLVAEKAEVLGMRVLLNDPPREKADKQRKNNSIHWASLDEVLSESDIISLHVPLTKEGPHATFHMANDAFFKKTKKGVIFFNTCRGAVVDTDALIRAISTRSVSHSVIDTWEGEPDFRKDLLDIVDIGTPHIAGHSFEGKVVGTYMVYTEACKFLGVTPEWHYENRLPPPPVPNVTINPIEGNVDDVLHRLVSRVYNIGSDDCALRKKTDNSAKLFDDLRRNYPIRREFRYTSVSLQNAEKELTKTINRLGFKTV